MTGPLRPPSRPWLSLLLLIAGLAPETKTSGAEESPLPWLRIRLAAPAGPTATAVVDMSPYGEPQYSGAIVSIGNSEVRVQAGASRKFTIAAGKELQEVIIDQQRWLIAVRPGTKMVLGQDPCCGYEPYGTWADGTQATAATAYCARREAPCRAGYVDGDGPDLAEDRLCSKALLEQRDHKRCVKASSLRVRLDEGGTASLVQGDSVLRAFKPGAPEAPQRFTFMRMDPVALRTPRGTFHLVIGIGESWTIHVDRAGAVKGTVDEGK